MLARLCMSPADRQSSCEAIQRLIATYAEPVDDGDFAAVGLLRFERRDRQWRFVQRRVRTDLVGDGTRHLRRSSTDP